MITEDIDTSKAGNNGNCRYERFRGLTRLKPKMIGLHRIFWSILIISNYLSIYIYIRYQIVWGLLGPLPGSICLWMQRRAQSGTTSGWVAGFLKVINRDWTTTNICIHVILYHCFVVVQLVGGWNVRSMIYGRFWVRRKPFYFLASLLFPTAVIASMGAFAIMIAAGEAPNEVVLLDSMADVHLWMHTYMYTVYCVYLYGIYRLKNTFVRVVYALCAKWRRVDNIHAE